MIVAISAIPIGRIRMTNQELAGGVPYAFIPLCLVREDLKKKTEKSDIVQKGRVGWTPKPYF